MSDITGIAIKELSERIERLERQLTLSWERDISKTEPGHWTDLARKGYVDSATLKMMEGALGPVNDRLSKLEARKEGGDA